MLDLKLAEHLDNRPAQLLKAKSTGVKVAGYLPGNYVPEELIYAAGAIPVCLLHGGDNVPVEISLSTIPQVFCPFTRAQIGEMVLKRNPYYDLPDIIISPITCQHLKKATEIWEYQGNIPIFKLGVPHQDNYEFQLEYFTDRLIVLKKRLEDLTGNEITTDRLNTSIDLYNRLRTNLNQINLLRRTDSPPLTSREFMELNHASFYADPVFMTDILESIYQKLQEKRFETGTVAPRLLLIGPNISFGDYRVLELVAEAGGNIVTEDVFEGIRNYRMIVNHGGDPVRSLASSYLMDRVPAAFIRYSARKRLDQVLRFIKDFRIDGIIWYELLCCETYDAESYYFSRKMEEHNVPMLILESDYGAINTGQFKTRIRAFMEMIKEE